MKQARQFVLIGMISVWVLAPSVNAVPPYPAPPKAELVKRSDLIAIVSVTKVTGRKVPRGKLIFDELCAVANVECVLKGTADDTIVLAYDDPVRRSVCGPPSLGEGRFLVFLKKHGTFFWRTDAWYGQHCIATTHVQWQLQHRQELNAAIKEIRYLAQQDLLKPGPRN